MNISLIGLVLLCCALSSANAFQQCRCEDYGSLDGCVRQNGCFWASDKQECLDKQPSCDNLPQAQCSAPGCLFVNNQCLKFDSCKQIKGDSNVCKNYGCVLSADEQTCEDFDSCPRITDPLLCTGFTNKGDKTDTVCYWHLVANTCVSFKGCKGTDLTVCKQLNKMCVINGEECDNLVCSKLNTAADCQNNTPYCTWRNQDNKQECVTNDCKDNQNEASCHLDQNQQYCAWDGKHCKKCFDLSGKIFSLAGILSLMIAVVNY